MQRNRLIMVLMFCLLLSYPAVAQVFTTKVEFSPQENRLMAQFPQFSMRTVRSGRFMENFERFFADQFVWRNSFMALRTRVDQVMRKAEISGIYLGAEGFLLERYREPNQTLWRNIDKLNSLVKRLPKDTPIYFLLAPTSAGVHSDKLPKNSPSYDQAKVIEQLKKTVSERVIMPDLLALLKSHSSEEIFYKTDHHWTSLGAFYAYSELMRLQSTQAYQHDSFYRQQVTNSFYGSYFYRINDKRFASDIIELWHPAFYTHYQVDFPYGNASQEQLYNWDKLTTNDKYGVFLGGNHPLAIVSTHVQNGRELLLIKDSFANCLVPFLANHYEKIHVVDLRYFGQDAAKYYHEQGLDEVLFTFGLSSLSNDSAIIR